jgi:hypothetical protein
MTIAALEAAMSDAIDRYEHAAMVARETDNEWWDWLAAEREREAEEAIAAFHAALDAEAAAERRDEALWKAEEQRIEQEREMERFKQRLRELIWRMDEGPY